MKSEIKPRILLVEDDEAQRNLISIFFIKMKIDIQVASTAEEALLKVKKKKPDIILLDVGLPGMNGLQLCEILKGDPKTSHIMIMMLTSLGSSEDIVAGLTHQADDYLPKPYSLQVLYAKINALVRRMPEKKKPKKRTPKK